MLRSASAAIWKHLGTRMPADSRRRGQGVGLSSAGPARVRGRTRAPSRVRAIAREGINAHHVLPAGLLRKPLKSDMAFKESRGYSHDKEDAFSRICIQSFGQSIKQGNKNGKLNAIDHSAGKWRSGGQYRWRFDEEFLIRHSGQFARGHYRGWAWWSTPGDGRHCHHHWW